MIDCCERVHVIGPKCMVSSEIGFYLPFLEGNSTLVSFSVNLIQAILFEKEAQLRKFLHNAGLVANFLINY